jgi:ribosomal protein S18 acetylase RimI-like enzyme
MVRLADVRPGDVAAFLCYVREHGAEYDDSYTQSEDLATFDPEREPAAAAFDANGAIVGTASLMVDGYAHEGLARFRILHASTTATLAPLAMRVLAKTPPEVRHAFLFLPEDVHTEVAIVLASLGFTITRRAYVLSNADIAATPFAPLPSGFHLVPAKPERAEDWTRVVNAAFEGQPGRYEMSAERAQGLLARRIVVRSASFLALREDEPVGVVLTVQEADGSSTVEIETLGVVPEAQGKGLGRALLTTALCAAAQAGFHAADLSVSTTNQRALGLYESVGFTLDEARVCWQKELPPRRA